MNDAQRLEAMDSYFGRYRKMMGRLKASEQEYEDNRKAYEQRRTELQEERTRITRELTNMRQVITKMIDDGIDPVMAGLIMNEEDAMTSTIWQKRDEESFGMTMNTDDIMKRIANSGLGIGQVSPNMQLSIGSMIGASGATGAIGAHGSITSMGANGGYQQGYGAIPPQHTHTGVTADMNNSYPASVGLNHGRYKLDDCSGEPYFVEISNDGWRWSSET
jgi:hypothetical protein